MHPSGFPNSVPPNYLWLHTADPVEVSSRKQAPVAVDRKISTTPLAADDALYLNADMVDVIWQRMVIQQRMISRLKKIVRRQQRILKDE